MDDSSKRTGSFFSSIRKMDWQLLVFLVLFVNVKLVIKLVALVFIYAVRPDLTFGFRFKQSRLPLFYPLILLIALIDYVLYRGFLDGHYTIAFLIGIAFWLACILAMHQVKLAVERAAPGRIHTTIVVFFILNIIVSFSQIARIIIETGEWNPYTYQGMFQKYFIGTGDYIRGLTFDTSTTNAALNAFAICYFLKRKSYLLVLCCMATLLLTCSNFMNIAVVSTLLFLFIFQSTRAEKSIIIVCFMLLILFMGNISPQNNTYAMGVVQKAFHPKQAAALQVKEIPVELKPDSLLTVDEKKQRVAQHYLDSLSQVSLAQQSPAAHPAGSTLSGRPVIPVANIHTPPYQHRRDSSDTRMQVVLLAEKIGRDTSISAEKVIASKMPGKFVAAQQTVQFLEKYPSKIVMGNGMGNFSSKLSFRATGLKVAGGYPKKYAFINDDFKNNHLSIFLDYFEKDSGFHSITNTPNSAYLQLLGEYGIAGLVLVFTYLFWFAKGLPKFSYGVSVLILLTGILLVDYWFEQLSVVVIFELLLFLNKKEAGYKKIP